VSTSELKTLWWLDQRGTFQLARVTRVTPKRVHILAADLTSPGTEGPALESLAVKLLRDMQRKARRGGAGPVVPLERSVSRAELDEHGSAFCSPLRLLLYTEAAVARDFRRDSQKPVRVDTAFSALGLTWPFTAEDATRAFRTLAKAAHPDTGGSHAAFISLQQTYQHALKHVQNGASL
jgi:hypothetical protein